MAKERASTGWSLVLLRIALGLVYVHFGLLKFYPDLSPAEMLGSQTVMRLSLQWIDGRTAMTYLAAMECIIGAALVFNVLPRLTLGLFLVHMAGTFLPLFVLPELMFKIAPFAPTLEGEFILKNVVFVAAGLSLLFPACRRTAHADSVPHQGQQLNQYDPARTAVSHAPSATVVPLNSRIPI